MWRTRLSLLVGVLLLLLALRADAGVLSQVSSGINEQSDNDDHDSGPASDDDDDGPRPSSSATDWGNCCYHDPAATLGYGYAQTPTGGVESQFYFGAQSVEDSNGSMTLEARASYENFGLGLRGTSYYEQVDQDEYLTLDLWSLGAFWRFDHDEKTSAFAEFGVAGLNNDDQLSLTGVQLGIRVDRQLGGELGVSGAARHFFFEDDIAANELVVGLHASVLLVSYRIVDFNVGPPLHGPEVGVRLEF
jgi:hypothetical protein